MKAIYYSLCIFLILSLLASVIFADKLKKAEKKHIIAAGYVALAAVVHALVVIFTEVSS